MDYEDSVNAMFKSLGAPSTNTTVIATKQVINEHCGSKLNNDLSLMEGVLKNYQLV